MTNNSPRIVVVDDNPASRYATSRVLRSAGWTVSEASTGAEGISLVTVDVDLVVLDVNLPDIDGFEVCRRIRLNPATLRVPVVHLSATFVTDLDKVQGLEAGADGYLVHPVEPPVLIATVKAFLRARNAEENIRLLNDELLAANRHKDEFLATLAHELRNPLAPISAALTLMQDCVHHPARVEELRDLAIRHTDQLKRLLNDLMDALRIRQGRIELTRSHCELRELIQQAVESAEPLLQERKQIITVELQTEPVYMQADAMRLVQAFTNVLVNAVKYTPVAGRIGVVSYCEDDFAVVTITDNGKGIKAEELAKAFELFMQLEADASQGGSGLGIGLALVKQLIELHHGSIELHSAGENRGATVTIRLPVATSVETETHFATELQKARHIREAKADAPQQLSRRVLIVDDMRAIQITFGRLVEKMGHTVATAASGREALELIPEFQPEIVFSDISMPDMNGYELAGEIRRRHQDSLFLVAMTGFGQGADRERALEEGFDQHMVKPPELETLTQFFADYPAGFRAS